MLKNFTNCIMQNKNILIITPFFAPETHAAVFRAHKLVKYLRREGWNPIVITVDTNYNYNEDVNLLNDLVGVEIHRTKYIEPSLRGLYMFFTGKDRTFKTLKKQGAFSNKTENEIHISESKISFKQKIYHYLLENWLNAPDRFWTWKKSAVKKANQLIKDRNIQFVYTTMPPFTTGEIGLKIKKQNSSIKWIADFRDPMTTVLKNHSKIKRVHDYQIKIEKSVFKKCDLIITASEAHRLIINDSNSGIFNDKIKFIPTGLDDDFIPNVEREREECVVFVGEFLNEYSGYIFDLIYKYNSFYKSDLKIKVIGNKLINQERILKKIKIRDTIEIIEFIDQINQNDLYSILKKSKAGILMTNYLWWCTFAKMVDYIALQMPVIALVPEISEAKTQLTKANLGLFLTNNLEQDLKILNNFFQNKQTIPNTEFCANYLATSQVKGFIKTISKL